MQPATPHPAGHPAGHPASRSRAADPAPGQPPRAAPPQLVLVHSPLVGPAFWQPVAEALCNRGVRAHAPRLPSLEYSYAPYWLAHAAGIASTLPEDAELVLVGHGAAGLLLPAIGRLQRNRRASARIAGYLFVDCDLPRDGASRLDLWDDQAAAQRLRERVGAGMLPRWREDDLRALLPDAAQRAAFVAALPGVPMHMYDEPVMVPDDWPEARCGYLGLSDQYRGAQARAHALGWPRRQLALHHLAPLTHVDAIAGALVELCREIGGEASGEIDGEFVA